MPLPIELPIAFVEHEVPVACVAMAAQNFQINPTVILAVMKAEGGRLGTAAVNTNQSKDVGPAQINSSWFSTLEKYGFKPSDIKYDGCANTWIQAWILRGCLDSNDDYWRGVGCYNSSTRKGVDKNAIYADKVHTNYTALSKYQYSWTFSQVVIEDPSTSERWIIEDPSPQQ